MNEISELSSRGPDPGEIRSAWDMGAERAQVVQILVWSSPFNPIRGSFYSLDKSHFYAAPKKSDPHQLGTTAFVQTVVLERDPSSSVVVVDRRRQQHDFRAILVQQGKQQIPYSLSAAGVLG